MKRKEFTIDHDGRGPVYLVGDAKPAPAYTLLTVEDLAKLPPQAYRIKPVLPEAGIAAIFGPSGSGKSFLAFDMAGAIAGRAEWFGYRVKPGPVVCLVLEGEGGLRNRIAAYRTQHGGNALANVRFIASPFDLLTSDLDALVSAIKGAGFDCPTVFIDTLNRGAPGADENSSVDMGRIIAACKRLQAETGGLVALVHHAGKDAAKGMRGHSSLFAALDAVIQVTRDGDRREWMLSKAKDGRDGEAHGFTLRVVDLGEDDDGDPVTSCAVEPAHQEQGYTPIRKRLSCRDGAVLTALHRAAEANGEPPTAEIKARFGGFAGAGAGRMVCHIDHWRAEAYQVIDADGDGQHAKKIAFQRARQRLQEAGYAQTMGGFWWAIFDDDSPAHNGTDRHSVPPCADKERHGTAHPSLEGVPGVPLVTVGAGKIEIITEEF